MIASGLARKPPGWRAGCWLLGWGLLLLATTTLLALPLGRRAGMYELSLVLIALGAAFTVPYGYACWRGRDEYADMPTASIRQLSPPAIVLHVLAIRLPQRLGDSVASHAWSIARVEHGKRARPEIPGEPSEQEEYPPLTVEPLLPWRRR